MIVRLALGLAALVAKGIAFLLALRWVRRSGRIEAERAAMQEAIDNARSRETIEDRVRRGADGAAAGELLRDWRRGD